MSQPLPNRESALRESEIITNVELVGSSQPKSALASNEQQTDPASHPTAPSKQSVFERMLSPQSLQIIMAAGGGILAIGFAIWLWSLGLFDNSINAAVSMGAVNLGLLGAGIWLVSKTRYSLAGRGLTFLSSLLLPLHLWFYHAQGLLVVDGGQLWIPALAICGLYALIARLTRNSIFVYTLVGGIVLTGLLFLAGPQTAFLWPVIPTCAFLVVLGTLAIHADRFFIEAKGAFSRNEFGKAFFIAGHLVIVGGLGYLLASQTLEPFFDWFLNLGNFYIGLNPQVNFWSLPILAIAGWAYSFSHISRRRGNLFVVAATGIAGWAVLTGLQVFAIQLTPNLILMLMAIGLLALQIGLKVFGQRGVKTGNSTATRIPERDSLVLSIANFMLAAAGIGQAILAMLLDGDFFLNPAFLAQGIFSALALGAGTEIVLGQSNRELSNFRLAGSSLLLSLIAVLTLGASTSLTSPVVIGILVSVIVVLTIANQFVANPRFQLNGTVIIAAAVGGIMLAFGAALIARDMEFGSLPALAIVVTSACLLIHAGFVSGRRADTIAGLFTLAMGLAQVFLLLNITSAQPVIIAISTIGMLVMVGSKLLEPVFVSEDANKKSVVANMMFGQRVGSVLIASGAAAALLFVFPKLLLDDGSMSNVGLLLFQLLPLAIGYVINRVDAWRHSFWALAIANVILSAITLSIASDLAIIYRVEMIALAAGVALLTAGHLGWAREQRSIPANSERDHSDAARVVAVNRSDSVSFGLVMGGILLALPMMIGLITFRLLGVEGDTFWKWFHDIGGLLIGLTLLGSGILCRIRSTTIAGFVTLLTYLVSLVVLIRLPEELQSVSVMMMVGGGLFFGVGILLSVYREWILGLPSKIREGEGVFKVLKWR